MENLISRIIDTLLEVKLTDEAELQQNNLRNQFLTERIQRQENLLNILYHQSSLDLEVSQRSKEGMKIIIRNIR